MECAHIPITNYTAFEKRLGDKMVGGRIPITGTIEVTSRCNLRCAHCYINLPAGDQIARDKEMSRQEIGGVLDQIVDEGCLWLLLTGGEPFIRPDFLDIYTHAKKKGLLITLFTNGTSITPRIADYLAEWPPFSLEITLYGRTQETYERVTGVPGSYKRCMQGIELVLARHIPLKLKTVVLTLNQHELWDINAYAEELGVDFRFDPVLNTRLDGSQNPADFRIPPEEVVALDLADAKRRDEWLTFCNRSWERPPQPERIYTCGAGVRMFHVDAYGQLSVCMMARSPSYDLRRGTFSEGWHDFIPRVRSQEWTRETICRDCELVPLCTWCPGVAQIETGDPEKPIAYHCQIAHLRAETFGSKTVTTGETP